MCEKAIGGNFQQDRIQNKQGFKTLAIVFVAGIIFCIVIEIPIFSIIALKAQVSGIENYLKQGIAQKSQQASMQQRPPMTPIR